MSFRILTKINCPNCYGIGIVRTGGCSLEHGISTSCEEYGCLPVKNEVCAFCKGEKFVTKAQLAEYEKARKR